MDDGRTLRSDDRRKMPMVETRSDKIRSVRDLKVYRKAFEAAMEIYEHIFAMLNSMEKKADSFCNSSIK